MELYIVRHAIAETRDPARWPGDRDRPLTPAGEARFRKVARVIGKRSEAPEHVFSSPLARAWRTAELLTEEASWPAPEPWGDLEPDRPAEAAAESLRTHATATAISVVGHEPGLSELASYLLGGRGDAIAIQLKKGGVIALDVGMFPEPGTATLHWAVPPRLLRKS